jgi:uncharacterized protein (TIGR03643 family)
MDLIDILEKNKTILSELASKSGEKLETLSYKNTMFSEAETDRIIQMAWEDRTPFEAIEFQFGLKEKEVIEFMRANSKLSSFKMWRKRMKSRQTKHLGLRNSTIERFKCSMQRSTGNRIAKR